MNAKETYGPNISTTPLRQRGFQQCLPFSRTIVRGNAVMGVVDTFEHGAVGMVKYANKPIKRHLLSTYCYDRADQILTYDCQMLIWFLVI